MVFKKYGLGLTTENNFKKIYGINLKTKVFLKQNIKNTFKNINSSIPVELVLFNKIKKNILFYKTIKNFRGTRH
jgi:ribosomal protein S13